MKRTIAAICCIVVAGCATIDGTYVPVIDRAGTDPVKLAADLEDCRKLAKERLDAAHGAIAGAVAGAVLGAAIGAVLGVRGRDLSQVAGATAISGAAGGGVGAELDQRQIIANCMKGRGYRVVGL